MGNTKIEWADKTWNVFYGCRQISIECDNCYAKTFLDRFKDVQGHQFEGGFDNFKFVPERLNIPTQWKEPKRIFVNSLSDTFYGKAKFSEIHSIFSTMEFCNWHTFMVLTKRPKRMLQFLKERYENNHIPSHIQIGVSVGHADQLHRLDSLRKVNASVRFVSMEPLVGPVGDFDTTGIHGVILGGESGPGARPMSARWAREVRDICIANGVKLFFKQWGNLIPVGQYILSSKEYKEFTELKFKEIEFQLTGESRETKDFQIERFYKFKSKYLVPREIDGQEYSELA